MINKLTTTDNSYKADRGLIPERIKIGYIVTMSNIPKPAWLGIKITKICVTKNEITSNK